MHTFINQYEFWWHALKPRYCTESINRVLSAHLPNWLDSFPERAVHDDPGQEEASCQLPPDVAKVVDALRYVQHEVTKHNNLEEGLRGRGGIQYPVK